MPENVNLDTVTQDILRCERCDYEWASDQESEKVTCSHCQYKTERNKVGEEVFMRGKMLFMKCESINDMLDVIESRMQVLRALRDEGFEIDDLTAIQDDYIYIRRYDDESE